MHCTTSRKKKQEYKSKKKKIIKRNFVKLKIYEYRVTIRETNIDKDLFKRRINGVIERGRR